MMDNSEILVKILLLRDVHSRCIQFILLVGVANLNCKIHLIVTLTSCVMNGSEKREEFRHASIEKRRIEVAYMLYE